MSTPTPGPWRVRNDREYVVETGTNPSLQIASVSPARDGYQANACLVAAAPELYESLSELLREFVVRSTGDPAHSYKEWLEMVERGESALMKARGAVVAS